MSEQVDAPAGTSPVTDNATEEIAQVATEVTTASDVQAETTSPAEKELAEIRGRSSDKPIVPPKAGSSDDGERERMRLLMRAEKVLSYSCS
jgi:hypothetical protein